MKTAQIKKIVKEALANKSLYYSQLDEILASDSNFDKSVKTLLKVLDKLPIVKDPNQEEPKGSRKRSKRSNSRYSANSNPNKLTLYIHQVNSHPKMNRAEEIRFSKRMEFMRNRLLHSVKISASPKEMRKLMAQLESCGDAGNSPDIVPLCKTLGGDCARGKKGFIKAACSDYNALRTEFVERNLHVSLGMAMQYRTYGVPLMDLIQEGNAALIRAVEKFDWRKEVRFQTYANFWIRQAVERYISANKGIVRIPNYLQQKMRRFKREGVIAGDPSELSVAEVSEAFDLSSEVAGHLIDTGRDYISLDTPTSTDDTNTISDMLAHEEQESLMDGEFENLQNRISAALASLTEQEQFIIRHRFGLEGLEVKTLEQIGKLMRVSRERIRQLQIRALQKLKKPALVEQLVPFLS
jgi:RNA polymerase sigma factor (sigma-70 family)